MIEMLVYPFFRNALLAGVLVAIACGIIGSYVVVKKIVFISGGVSHSAFGGIGLGYLMGFDPLIGAAIFSVCSALAIGVVSRRGCQSEDTVIGAMWATGMALGIIFISLAPGYAPDLIGYLFGNILFVRTSDLILMLVLDCLIAGVVYLLYNDFLAVTFDEEFAEIAGLRVEYIYYLLLVLIALTVVMLIQVVGVILVIALMTIPAAISRWYCSNLRTMMALSMLLGLVFIFAGIWLSYLCNAPSGATIILVSAAVYAILIIVRNRKVGTPCVLQ